jgi:hypothetical protein
MKKVPIVYLLLLVAVIILIAVYKTYKAKPEYFQLQGVTGPQMLCAIRNGQAKPELVSGAVAFKQFIAGFNVKDAMDKQKTNPNYVRNLVCPTPKPGVVTNTSFCGPVSDLHRNKKAKFTIKC